MAQLHQMQIQFSPHEDRLLLRVNTQDKAEYRFWLSRRYVKMLWPVLVRMIETNHDIRLQTDAQTKSTIMAFQHEHALSNSNFSKPYQSEAASTPLGVAPLLLARIRVKQKDAKSNLLCLHPARGHGIEFEMNQTLLHSFCKLLSDGARTAGWDLELNLARPAYPPSQVSNKVN